MPLNRSIVLKRLTRSACAELTLNLLREIQKPRKRRKWVCDWIGRREKLGASALILKELAVEDKLAHRNVLRLSKEKFEELLALVTPHLTKKDTIMRSAIPCKIKLEITLRYLASGDSLMSLQYLFRVPQNTISAFLPEVFKAIYNVLESFIKVPDKVEEWQAIQKAFETKWNFPNCCGALDGKHIAIVRPKNSTSTFYNYKGFYSIVLFGMVDADYCFRYIDVGSDGRASDSTIFRVSKLNIALENNLLNWPEGGLCVGDDAFPLRANLLKPYSSRKLTLEEQIFNYRLSRARRVSENGFGILASRFRIFQRPIDLKVETTELLVKAACALHNWLRVSAARDYFPSRCVDEENLDTGEINPGNWRQVTNPFLSVDRNSVGYLSNHYPNDVETVRKSYARAFATTLSVPWQLQAVQNC